MSLTFFPTAKIQIISECRKNISIFPQLDCRFRLYSQLGFYLPSGLHPVSINVSGHSQLPVNGLKARPRRKSTICPLFLFPCFGVTKNLLNFNERPHLTRKEDTNIHKKNGKGSFKGLGRGAELCISIFGHLFILTWIARYSICSYQRTNT